MHRSVATIKEPEFINLKPLEISPSISQCEIKVMYLEGNRNGSYISKDVATEMAKSLRGNPIVGVFREDANDFGDHGNKITIEGGKVKFECTTRPYGFVAPDAKVWFKEFEDEDEFGNKILRTYLMTTGYLWTGQYEECSSVVESGKSHSMELDDKTLEGYWATNPKTNMEYFIINDALFTKLCILGDDVEPCFEGSSITAPDISKNFSKEDTNINEFNKSLYNMMQELQFALKGGKKMDNNETAVVQQPEVQTPAPQFQQIQETPTITVAPVETVNKEEYSALNAQYENLKTEFAELNTKYQELVVFKNKVEDEKKDEMINSFYMLSDEDKKDVIENKSKYSVDEIESKLSVICVRKKVNFGKNEESEEKIGVQQENTPVTTFSLDSIQQESVPDFVSALRNTRDNRNK